MNTNTDSSSNPQQEIANAIAQQYQQCIPKIRLLARVNPTFDDFRASLERAKPTSEKRFLFHYSCYDAAEVTANEFVFQQASDWGRHSVRPILEQIGASSVHVIDCDYAGRLVGAYADVLGSSPPSHFAFFSCGGDERLPRSPDLPADLFTSCLTTPGRIALLWHSRHYFCSKDSPLHPLKWDFCQAADAHTVGEVALALHRFVEAMAYEEFPQDLFLHFFHTDQTVAHLTANFCLAVRILSFFNVTPLCFPPIPDLRNHQLWHAFDLRLDVALLQLQSPSPVLSLGYRTFLEQSIQTLRHITLVDTPDVSFPCQLTQLPTILSTFQQQDGSCNLPVAGCQVLAAYIDKSVNAIRQVLMFPIVGPLFHLFPKGIGGGHLLLAMVKIVCFMPETRQILQHMCADVFGEFIELFALDKPLFPLMLAVFVLRDSPRMLETLNGRWADAILPLLANPYDDVRLWALMLLMTVLPAVPDAHIALERVVRRLDDDCPAVRIAALQTLCCFPKHPEVVPAAAQLARDLDSLVRSQLVVTLSKLPRVPKTDEAFALLRSDPSPHVRRETESYVYDWFLSSVLSPLNRLIREPKLSFAHVQGAALVVECVRIPPRKLDHLQSVQLTAQQSGPELPRVSSNLAMTSNGCLLFGCRDGEVCLVDQSAHRLCAVGQAPICHVHHTANYGYPITFASSADASMYILKTGSELEVTNSFRLNEPCRMFECGPRNLYVVNAQSIAAYDLVRQKQLQNLSWTRPKVVRVASAFSDVVAIAGDCLEFFDTRVGYQNIAKYDGVKNIVDVFDIGANPYQFAVCHAKPVVSVIDLRRQQIQSHAQIAQDDVQTLSFSGQQGGSAVLIGTSRGVCLFDCATGSRVEKSSASAGLLFQKKVTGASQCAFDPSRFRFAVLNEDGELITVVGEVKPET